MIKSLRTAIERYRCVWNKSAIGCTYPELHHFHLCETPDKSFGIDHFFHSLVIAFIGDKSGC